MKRASGRRLWLCVILSLLVVMQLPSANADVAATRPDGAVSRSSVSTGYPRLATIYSKTDINSAAGKQAIAKFPLYVTDFGWWPDTNYSGGVPTGLSVGEYLKQLNPSLLAIIYQ